MEKVFDAFTGGKIPFKTTYKHPDGLKRTLTPEPLTTAPKIEDVSGIPQYNTSSRQSRLELATSSIIPVTGILAQGKGPKILPPKQPP